jgi:SAM-dependent methyltransferase
LRALKARATQAGCAERVRLVVAAAEALPFAPGSVPAIYTKSVLIHTELEQAAREIARTLAPGGRAALVEPQPGNPFVEAYRRWLAPKAWRSITRYFDPAAQGVFIHCKGMTGAAKPVAPFYFLAFFAFVFQFAWPQQRLYRITLGALHGVDRILFRLIPPLRRWAWFGVIRLEKRKDPERIGEKSMGR